METFLRNRNNLLLTNTVNNNNNTESNPLTFHHHNNSLSHNQNNSLSQQLMYVNNLMLGLANNQINPSHSHHANNPFHQQSASSQMFNSLSQYNHGASHSHHANNNPNKTTDHLMPEYELANIRFQQQQQQQRLLIQNSLMNASIANKATNHSFNNTNPNTKSSSKSERFGVGSKKKNSSNAALSRSLNPALQSHHHHNHHHPHHLHPSNRSFHPHHYLHDEPKPQHSYIGLIAIAILSMPDQKMVLADIYQHILDNYRYFRNRGPGWRNSIRHNLSLNDCFIKAGRSANGKGHYWAIHPANLEDFKKGDFRRRKAQRKVRRHMGLSVPDDDDDDDSPLPSPPLPPPLPPQPPSLPVLGKIEPSIVMDSKMVSSTIKNISSTSSMAFDPAPSLLAQQAFNFFNSLRIGLPIPPMNGQDFLFKNDLFAFQETLYKQLIDLNLKKEELSHQTNETLINSSNNQTTDVLNRSQFSIDSLLSSNQREKNQRTISSNSSETSQSDSSSRPSVSSIHQQNKKSQIQTDDENERNEDDINDELDLSEPFSPTSSSSSSLINEQEANHEEDQQNETNESPKPIDLIGSSPSSSYRSDNF